MENQIFTDPGVKPENDILETALGKKYILYAEFEKRVNELNFILEWNYYNDGKSWLCKTLHKKKNFGWLSAWNTGIKLTFYFTEKTITGLQGLGISPEININAKEIKPVGKFYPVTMLMKSKKAINDGIKILEYKKNLK
jgi:hypothetical protein